MREARRRVGDDQRGLRWDRLRRLAICPERLFPGHEPGRRLRALAARDQRDLAREERVDAIDGRPDAVDRALQLRVLRIVGRDVREILRQRRAPLAIAVEEQRLAGRDVAAHGGLFVEQFGEDVARGGVERVRRFDARRLALHGVHLQDRDAGDDGEQEQDEGKPGADLAADAEGHDSCPCGERVTMRCDRAKRRGRRAASDTRSRALARRRSRSG